MTAVEVCNYALTMLGQTTELVSLSDGTRTADLCRRFFPWAMKEMLTEHNWHEATKVKPLDLDPGTNDTRWEFMYYLPSDFIRLIATRDEEGQEYRFDDIEHFELMDGRLYSDVENLWIKYVAYNLDKQDEEDTILKMSVPFCYALAMAIAVRLAGSLATDQELVLALQQSATVALYKARAFDGAQRRQNEPLAEWSVNN